MLEGVFGVLLSNGKHSLFESSDEVGDGVRTELFEKGFEFSEKMLYGVEVG